MRRWISTQQPDGDVVGLGWAGLRLRWLGWVGLTSSCSIHRRQHRTAQKLLGLQSGKVRGERGREGRGLRYSITLRSRVCWEFQKADISTRDYTQTHRPIPQFRLLPISISRTPSNDLSCPGLPCPYRSFPIPFSFPFFYPPFLFSFSFSFLPFPLFFLSSFPFERERE